VFRHTVEASGKAVSHQTASAGRKAGRSLRWQVRRVLSVFRAVLERVDLGAQAYKSRSRRQRVMQCASRVWPETGGNNATLTAGRSLKGRSALHRMSSASVLSWAKAEERLVWAAVGVSRKSAPNVSVRPTSLLMLVEGIAVEGSTLKGNEAQGSIERVSRGNTAHWQRTQQWSNASRLRTGNGSTAWRQRVTET
jgi:hypothetical protein